MARVIGRPATVIIAASTLALMLAVVSSFGVYLSDVFARTDRGIFLKDTAALKQGLFLLGEFAAAEQVGLAEGNEAYENISTRYNQVWVERNFGKGAFANADQQEVLLVAASGEILHSSNKAPGRMNRVETLRAARLTAAKARRALNRVAGADPSSAVGLTSPLEGELHGGAYSHAYALLDGRAAIVSAAVVLPDREALTSLPDAPVVLVSVRPVGDRMLSALGGMTGLGDLRFDRRLANGPDLWSYRVESVIGAGEPSSASDTGASADQVFAIWPRKKYGVTIWAAMVPALAAMASAMALLLLGMAVFLYRTGRRDGLSETAAVQSPEEFAGTASGAMTAVSVDALRHKAEELREVEPVGQSASTRTA